MVRMNEMTQSIYLYTEKQQLGEDMLSVIRMILFFILLLLPSFLGSSMFYVTPTTPQL